MNKKIVEIVVLMLLISTTLPVVGALNKNNKFQDLEFKSELQKVELLSTIPDDTYFDLQWSLHNTGQTGGTADCDIDAPEAWDIETGDSDVVIAIIDTGVDYTHPDLAANIWENPDEIDGNGIDDDGNGYIDDVMGWDFWNDDNDPLDENGHGTHCAGIVAAVTDNNIGIAGLCWNGKIMPLKYHNNQVFNLNTIIEAIEYAADNDADIISMSLGTSNYIESFEDAVNYAYDKGVFVCASAGNDDTSTKRYPAGFDNVTAVAATDCNDSRMEYFYEKLGIWVISNYGEWVDVAAPGQEIYSTMPTYDCWWSSYGFSKNYENLSGTSMAAPRVAGLAALLLSKNPLYSPNHLKAIICDEDNVDPYDSIYYIGTGRINAYKALNANLPPDAPTIDGETIGKPGKEYEYTFNAVDPEDEDVKYFVDWDDDSSEWTDFYESGSDVKLKHIWSEGEYVIKAKAVDINDQEGDVSEFSVIIAENLPPYTPSNPTPANHATDVDINADLYWDGGDPDDPDENVTYDVYFGTSSDPPKLASNISDTNYDPGTMGFSTKYYWKIVSWDNHGASATGPIWDFTTGSEPNDPPEMPSNPDPADEATDVSIDADLSWDCSDPDGDEIVYDIYLEAGDETPDVLVSDDQTETTFDPGPLKFGTTYYWQIIAIDEHSASTTGLIWQFTTEENNPPDSPNIDGPDKGKPETSYEYGFTAVDPDGHDIAEYIVDWDDGSGEETVTGPFESGEEATASHSWDEKGTYKIKSQAIDIYGVESDWSEFEVSIPRNRAINYVLFERLLERFPYIFPLMRQLLTFQ